MLWKLEAQGEKCNRIRRNHLGAKTHGKNIIKWPLILACASCALPSILGRRRRRISPALKVLLILTSGPGDDAAA
jgi:hypothetical protein